MIKYITIPLLIFLFILPVFASEDSDFVSSFNESFVITTDQLTINESKLIPDKVNQSHGKIVAWVDIVGYEQQALIGNRFYIQDYIPVVRSDAWANITNCPSRCGVSAIYKNINISQLNNNTIARLDVTLYWWYISCGIACIKIERPVSASFYDNETTPEQFQIPDTQNLTIYHYNSSDSNLLQFDNLNSTITNYTITTPNGSIIHQIKLGTVDYTNKGVPFMNVTGWNDWKISGNGIYHEMDDILAENTTYNITYGTPFGSANISTNTTYKQVQPSHIDFYIFKIYAVLALLIGGAYLMYRA